MYPEKGKGEGFSVVALQCILIEFFEAFYQGKIYVHKENKDLDENTEYNSSRKMFKDFLRDHEPFKSQFTKTFRDRFFGEFRCGLLHEAATKGSSIIITQKTENDRTLIEKDENGNIILYRTPFQKALEEYLETYKTELMSSPERKTSFKRKMDELCQITMP